MKHVRWMYGLGCLVVALMMMNYVFLRYIWNGSKLSCTKYCSSYQICHSIQSVVEISFLAIDGPSLAWPDHYFPAGRLSLAIQAPAQKRVWEVSQC